MEETNDTTHPYLMDKPVNRWGIRFVGIFVYCLLLAFLGLLGGGLVRAQRGQVKTGLAPDFTLTTVVSPELEQKIEELLVEKYP